MKNQRGVTLVALIIIIIVMLILAGVSIGTGTESLDNTRLKGFYAQLEMIQKRVDDIAVTNESYIDSNGNHLYLKKQGKDLKTAQQSLLQSILKKEELSSLQVDKFRYFTAEDLQNILDLLDSKYNVFIDFENRVVVAENGIKIGDKTYHVLENTTYFVKQNEIDKNKGTIQSLNYKVTKYGDKYKVVVTPSNVIGDINGTGHVKYKKTTTKYWETSNNTEIIVETSVEYNIVYIDANNNSLEKIIKVELDSNGTATVTEV